LRVKESRRRSYPIVWLITLAAWVPILISYFVSEVDATLMVFLILIVLVASAVADWLLSK